MISGGDSKVGTDQVAPTLLKQIFDDFKTADDQARKSSQEKPKIMVKGKDVYLSRREEKSWIAYSRTTKMPDQRYGKWLTVQAFYHKTPDLVNFTDYTIKFFNETGRELDRIEQSGDGELGKAEPFGLSDTTKQFLEGALNAVTGKAILVRDTYLTAPLNSSL